MRSHRHFFALVPVEQVVPISPLAGVLRMPSQHLQVRVPVTKVANAEYQGLSQLLSQPPHRSLTMRQYKTADVTRSMYMGEGKFEGKAHPKLRIIANLYPEDLHLVMPKGSSMTSLAELEGKRVGIAQAGSGTQVAVLQMLEAWGITRDNIDEAELNNSQSAERLADGQIDAYFYAAGWPVAAMVQLSSTKGMSLHSFSEADLKKINDIIPAYIPSKIPGGVYEGIDTDTLTPAVSALLVVSSDLEEELVYGITKALWNSNTRKLLDNGHAKGKQITSETALDGVIALGVPLHSGAEKFYKEAGLLK
jgi:TRAP transporter TAXI family solute receptor